jgi:hypothetical protein
MLRRSNLASPEPPSIGDIDTPEGSIVDAIRGVNLQEDGLDLMEDSTSR